MIAPWHLHEAVRTPATLCMAGTTCGLVASSADLSASRAQSSPVEISLATSDNPAIPSAAELYSAGLLAEQNGDRELAHALYIRSIALDPHFKTFERLGTLAAEKDNWEEAAAHYLRATEAGPGHARPHFFLAQAYLQLGKGSLAEASAATAVRLNP
jgi:tetratricopeptide (TPR) repeat protein